MNNKILELAEQAGFGVENGSILAETISTDIEITAELEKFAELIVRECFKIVDDYGIEQAGIAEENYCGEQLYVSMKITDSAYKIKEHFGIK